MSVARERRVSFLQQQEDREIIAGYKRLANMGVAASAQALGVGQGRLMGALERTGTPRHELPVRIVQPQPWADRRTGGWQALPAGSPETWDCLGCGPWPFGKVA